MAFANGTHGGTGWISVELSTLVNRLLGVPDEVIRTDVRNTLRSGATCADATTFPGHSPMFV